MILNNMHTYLKVFILTLVPLFVLCFRVTMVLMDARERLVVPVPR